MQPEVEVLFEQTMNRLISVLEGMTENQINIVPFPGSWTAGQVGDHLYRSYWVIETLNGTTKVTSRQVDKKTPDIKALFFNFDIKMNSPKAILPSKDYLEKDHLIKNLKARILQFTEFIKKEDLSLICKDFKIPEYGPFTRLEWVYFTIYHTMRHFNQIEKIKVKLTE